MKLHTGFDTQQIMRMLKMALNKEEALWSSVVYSWSDDKTTLIGPESRDDNVRWLVGISRKLKFHPETVVLSVSILDRFLNSVKAHLKHIKLIGVSCLYVSAKILEEDVMVPGALEMVRESECGCSVAELLRMERVILDKLNWNISSATILDFIHQFHALLMSNYPQLLVNCVQMTPSKQMSVLTRKVHSCLAYHGLLTFKPSVVALSILSLELEMFCTDWFSMITGLQNVAKIDSESMMLCREKVTLFLASISQPPTLYLQSPAKHSAALGGHTLKAPKRKVRHTEHEDDVYDAIKRLYNDDSDNSLGSQPPNASCASEVLQDGLQVLSVPALVK